MDYIIHVTVIVFLLYCIGLIFSAAKSIGSSKNFPTLKEDLEKKENDE